jgi:hypothetical protein
MSPHGGGAGVVSNNRDNRMMVEHYQRVIEQQQDEIEEFRRQLEELERPRPTAHRPYVEPYYFPFEVGVR